ncbi:MAG: DUF4013 domain-containing protein [Eggerthellaceae bacterium]|nr:DUF4013 domain-containing protein [Eggerthellaceae bacterium]
MQIEYFKTAFNDIKSTPYWIGKLCLLTLVSFIPIFGTIVVGGYLYGWARDVAWGINAPMPKQIFGNEDGKLYERGFYILLLSWVLSFIPLMIYYALIVIPSLGLSAADPYAIDTGALAAVSIFSLLINLVYIAVTIFVSFFIWVGSMRISIYGQLSPGFQLKKIWAMIRKDPKGIFKILGMSILIGFIIGFIATIIVVIGIVLVAAAMGLTLAGIGADPGYVVGYFLGMIVFLLVFMFPIMVLAMWLQALVARALGYWTWQFNVPLWRGKDDPMPFEQQQQVPVQNIPNQ